VIILIAAEKYRIKVSGLNVIIRQPAQTFQADVSQVQTPLELVSICECHKKRL
jgi:hypothetical protein